MKNFLIFRVEGKSRKNPIVKVFIFALLFTVTGGADSFADSGSASGIVRHLQKVSEPPVQASERNQPVGIKEEVEQLRQEKKRKFKELTRGFIKKTITEESVQSKKEFLESGAKSLEDCIKRAIQVHLPAKASQERIKLSKQRVVKALRDLFAEASYDMEERNGSLSGQAFTGNSYHVKFKQPMFRGGNLWHTFLKEQATLRGAEAEYQKTINDLIEELSRAYFDILRTQNAFHDKQALLSVANSILRQSKKKLDAGLISEIEYLNVDSQQSQLAHDVEQARQDYELAALELRKNLGLEINDPIDVTPFYDYAKVMTKAWDDVKQESDKVGLFAHNPIEFEKPLDEYVQMAYDHRPDLKMEANRLRANIMAKRASVGKLLPQLNMVMEFGELAESFTDIVDDPAHHPEWQAVVEFSWNLAGNTVKYNFDRDENAPSVSQFQSTQGSSTDKNSFSMALLDNLEDVYKVKEAQVDVLDQFVKLEEKEREVIKQVKESYFDFRRAEIQLASAIKQLLYREKLAKLQKHKLEQNEVQSSEYLQSEIELVEEKAKFHKAMSDYYVARAALNRAVGIKSLLPIEQWGEKR